MKKTMHITMNAKSEKAADGVYKDIEEILEIAQHYGHITDYKITEKDDQKETSNG